MSARNRLDDGDWTFVFYTSVFCRLHRRFFCTSGPFCWGFLSDRCRIGKLAHATRRLLAEDGFNYPVPSPALFPFFRCGISRGKASWLVGVPPDLTKPLGRFHDR